MELLQRFAAGDLDAFEALFRLHQREVYAWIVRIVRDTGIAEDLTVELSGAFTNIEPASNPTATSARGRAESPPTQRSTICGTPARKSVFPRISLAPQTRMPSSAAKLAAASTQLFISFPQNTG
ncbi:MAG TPA: hypothetical protein VGI46_11205 [Candidatus Acidoferrum sp.]|jgi:hypothetical protein